MRWAWNFVCGTALLATNCSNHLSWTPQWDWGPWDGSVATKDTEAGVDLDAEASSPLRPDSPPFNASTGATDSGVNSSQSGAVRDAGFDGADGTQQRIVWQNGTTGQTTIWFLSGGRRVDTLDVWSRTSLDVAHDLMATPGWEGVGLDDFNQDGEPDILFHNANSGVVCVWYMDGAQRIGVDDLTIPGNSTLESTMKAETGWSVGGIADFNRDKNVDILWHNDQTGLTSVWYLRNMVRIGTGRVSTEAVTDVDAALTAANGWRMCGASDFDRDGSADIVVHNVATGELVIWYLDGLKRTREANIDAIDDPTLAERTVGLRLAATNDVNRDGSPDLVWHQGAKGWVSFWYLLDAEISAKTRVAADVSPTGTLMAEGAGWRLVGAR